jgi:hypothetical protein
MLNPITVPILSKPCLRDRAYDTQPVISGPWPSVVLGVWVGLSGRLSGRAGWFRRKKDKSRGQVVGIFFLLRLTIACSTVPSHQSFTTNVQHSPAISTSTPPLFSGPEAARTLPPLMCKPHRRKKRLVSPFLEHAQATPLTLTTVPPQLLQQ